MADIKNKSIEALQTELTTARDALRTFRYASAGSRTKNVREGRELRKTIARLLTEVRARSLAKTEKTA
ncbi:MAG: Ribosomal protein [Candidatus Parcubacteria bacterium]|jgi:ribosomal protein L29